MLRKLVCVGFHSSPGVGARALPLANRGSRGSLPLSLGEPPEANRVRPQGAMFIKNLIFFTFLHILILWEGMIFYKFPAMQKALRN
jgi:hypothetical protein